MGQGGGSASSDGMVSGLKVRTLYFLMGESIPIFKRPYVLLLFLMLMDAAHNPYRCPQHQQRRKDPACHDHANAFSPSPLKQPGKKYTPVKSYAGYPDERHKGKNPVSLEKGGFPGNCLNRVEVFAEPVRSFCKCIADGK